MALRVLLRWVLTLGFGLVCLAPMTLWAQVMPVAQPGTGAQDATPHLQYFEDTTAALDFDQVQQAYAQGKFHGTAGGKDALALGFTRSAFWLRLTIDNASTAATTQMLGVANARISYVTLYAVGADGRYQETATGGDMPFATRTHPNRNFIFALALPANSRQTVYLRVQSTIGLIVPVQLWAQNDFARHERHDYMVQAWYFGVALAMAVFNFLLFLTLRDRAYALYVAFVGFSVLTLGLKTGMASEFLWPQTLTWANPNYYMATSWGLVCFLAFMRSMLRTAHYMPRIDRAIRAGMSLHALMPVLYWTALQSVARATILLFIASCVALFGVVCWCIYKRVRAAYFFGAAFVALMSGSLMTLLRAVGVLPTNVLTVDGLQAGSTLEMLLLAFALADRYNALRQEKLQAQRDLVLAKQRLVETLQASERTLTQRVEERTRQLQILNEKLEALTLVDGLTGVANRRHFDQMLHKEWLRMERLRQPLALLMLDVDWFKAYNDHYGHQAGDQCLRAVATAIAGLSRASDLVARYGGEEFVLIAPATDSASAMALGRRICEAVRALALEHLRSDQGVITISVGVAALIPVADQPAAELLRAADAALYLAKAQGRNQAVLAGGLHQIDQGHLNRSAIS